MTFGDHATARGITGRITWIGERTAIITRDIRPGSTDFLIEHPQTPLVGHPWTASHEVFRDEIIIAIR